MPSNFALTETRYGFQWGPAIIERTASDDRLGVWLTIRSGRQTVDVRITKSGLIRLGEPARVVLRPVPFEEITG